MSGTPRLSVRDTLDGLYYVYSFYPDINDFQWLRDPEGNLVQANPFNKSVMFKAVAVGTESVALTLADGKIVYLPLYSAKIPAITFTPPAGITYNPSTFLYSDVLPNTSYTVSYTVTNVPDNLQIDAIGLDGAVVTSLVKTPSSTTITGTITFKTPAVFPEPEGTTRVLVFLTWGGNVTMQVLEFKNKIS
jgi:hypothetical protein